jgi:hypothetical protein
VKRKERGLCIDEDVDFKDLSREIERKARLADSR